jgi:hypothetical protein
MQAENDAKNARRYNSYIEQLICPLTYEEMKSQTVSHRRVPEKPRTASWKVAFLIKVKMQMNIIDLSSCLFSLGSFGDLSSYQIRNNHLTENTGKTYLELYFKTFTLFWFFSLSKSSDNSLQKKKQKVILWYGWNGWW